MFNYSGFSVGNAVIHEGRRGHVIAISLEMVPAGQVPIMYDDEANCFVLVPADDLKVPEISAAIAAS